MALDLDDARRRYHYALSPEDHGRVPFYSELLAGLEGDPVALELLAGVRAEQRNPMLVLAALHLAALRGHQVLAPIYGAVTRGDDVDLRGAVRAVLEALHQDPNVVRRELHRSTQTNEPGRSAVLQVLVSRIAREQRSINLVDVGTSAGINLRLDQFPVRATDDGKPLTLVCEDLTPIDRSAALPEIVSRVGIDPAPLKLDESEDRLWLRACLWPEERRRHDRFEAILTAWASWPPSTTLVGTALERLDDALALGDPEALTVVVNTWAVAYFPPGDQVAFFDLMSRRCREGNVAWVSIELPIAVSWPAPSPVSPPPRKGASLILVTLPGEAPRPWGWCHAHGHWLWLDAPAA